MKQLVSLFKFLELHVKINILFILASQNNCFEQLTSKNFSLMYFTTVNNGEVDFGSYFSYISVYRTV